MAIPTPTKEQVRDMVTLRENINNAASDLGHIMWLLEKCDPTQFDIFKYGYRREYGRDDLTDDINAIRNALGEKQGELFDIADAIAGTIIDGLDAKKSTLEYIPVDDGLPLEPISKEEFDAMIHNACARRATTNEPLDMDALGGMNEPSRA